MTNITGQTPTSKTSQVASLIAAAPRAGFAVVVKSSKDDFTNGARGLREVANVQLCDPEGDQ
ncbi:Uncharacterised protein [Mycobacteroides abscessus subsp. massiliense]|uniref:hypothetical protein n=1 Tax=Mycobacteroides abscessus TaxID=36809 RepID=UPI0009A771B7|nr:hypothetical protein [Mycobacteroides abscessus]SKK91888.1 Uncharacterised protein [Mycobacteroides abscessus subsp. massiliense]